MPSKATRKQQANDARMLEDRRRFIDLLPGPDPSGHVIPLVAKLVNEIHTETGMRVQTNSRHVRAVLGRDVLKLYVVPPRA